MLCFGYLDERLERIITICVIYAEKVYVILTSNRSEKNGFPLWPYYYLFLSLVLVQTSSVHNALVACIKDMFHCNVY